MSLSYDPEFLEAFKPMLALMANQPKPAPDDVKARRDSMAALASVMKQFPAPPSIVKTEYDVTSYDGQKIKLYHYAHQDVEKQVPSAGGPAVIAIHGGGYIAGSATMYTDVYAGYAEKAKIQVFAVEYRLAPEHPYPTPVEDVYACLRWVHEHATEFHVDTTRIAVMGDSAGGGIAASIALTARDRHLSPPLAAQLLFYPMLDDRTTTADPALVPFLIYNDAFAGWSAYLGAKHTVGGADVPVNAAPARADVLGLPRSYIDVGTLDLFRDEDMQYAARLAKANIQTEFHLYPGVPHAFEALFPHIDVSKRAITNRLKFLQSV